MLSGEIAHKNNHYYYYYCTCASILMSFVKWNPRFFAVVKNDMTLCPDEREVQFKSLCIYLDLFSISQYLTSEIHISKEEIAV